MSSACGCSGAEVVGVNNGSRTLKDAISEAMRDWVTNVGDTYYLLGSALGAHPYPMMVRDFHRVIGDEARAQILAARRPAAGYRVRLRRRRLAMPSACSTRSFRMTACEADRRRGGRPRAADSASMRRASRGGAPGVLHGSYSYLLQDEDGQVSLTHSVSAGLDYALIGPEHAWLHDQGRAEYCSATDADAIAAAKLLARTEGIIPALESAHAIAEAIRRAPDAKGQIFIVNLSGRGDKDIDIYRENIKELDDAAHQ